MFPSGTIRRRLAALLRPWLREEPELELSLGLISSHAVAKNLRFDTAALNRLGDDSDGFLYKEVSVEQLSVRFSNWLAPAFSIEFHGVKVVLSTRELKKKKLSEDTFAEDMKKKKLSEIDPQGSAVHAFLEKLMATSTTPKNKFKTSLLNLLLTHCQLQLHEISLQVQVPILNDSFVCSLDIEDINVDPQYLDRGCLLRGLFGTLFVPSKESSFAIVGSGCEVGFKKAGQLKRVLLLTELCSCIKLNDFQLVDINLRVPEIHFSFSPDDLSVYLAFTKASSQESHRARDGRQLWKLAASRIDNMTSAHRWSLQKSAVVVCFWLRYVNAYKYLLLLIGYYDDHLLKRSAIRIYEDKMLLSSVENQWKVISDIEKELPAEAIAQAWRVARNRAASNVQCPEYSSKKPFVTTVYNFLLIILSLLACAWRYFCKIVLFIMHPFVFRKILVNEPKSADLDIVSEGPCTQFCFSLMLGKVQITISHRNEIQLLVNEKLKSHLGITYSDSLSFRLSVDALLLKYVDDMCEESLLISCGQLKVRSSSLMEAPVKESSSKLSFSSMEAHWKESNDKWNNILWGEPAEIFPLLETSETGCADHVEGSCVSFLKDMWLDWRSECDKFGKSEIQYSETPFLLCEFKNFLIYPDLKTSDSGFWKFYFVLGKLNLVLGYSSIVSLSLLFRQIQHTLCWGEANGQSPGLSHSPRTSESKPEISLDSKYKCYANRLEMALLKMLPKKHVQLGVFIAGPHILMSLGKNFDGGNKDKNHVYIQDDFHLAFDVHNIEAAVWPTSKFDLASFVGPSASDDVEPECLRMDQPLVIDISNSNNGKYQAQGGISLGSYIRVDGLDVCLVAAAGKRQSQILVSKPMTLQLLSSREYVHSFSTNVIAFSAALFGKTEGFTILSYMDEFDVLFQVLANLSSAVSYSFRHFASVSDLPLQFGKQQYSNAESDNEQTTAHEPPLNYSSVLFSTNGTFKIKSMNIIVHKSRMRDNVGSCLVTSDASSSKQLSEHDLPDYGIWISVHQTSLDMSCKEGKVILLSNLSEIQSSSFRYKNRRGKSTDQSVLSDLLLQSLDCIYQLSLSSCVLSLSLFLSQNCSSIGTVSNTLDTNSVSETEHTENFPFTNSESSGHQNYSFIQGSELASNIRPPGSSHWLLVNLALGKIYVGRCSAKNVMNEAHQLNKFLSSVSVGGEFQRISCEIQGGFLFLETTASATLLRCFSSYLDCSTNILSGSQSSDKHVEEDKPIEEADTAENMTRPDSHSDKDCMQEIPCTSPQVKGGQMEAFSLNISRFSCALVIQEENGAVQELVLEIDAHLNVELENMRRKFIFKLSRISILFQVLQEILENQAQSSQVSSVTSNIFQSHAASGASTGSQHMDEIHPVNNASSSRGPGSQEERSEHSSLHEVFRLSHHKYILKGQELASSECESRQEGGTAFISVEKPLNEVWVGSGTISCFDITISLSQIQMLLSMISSFSGVFGEEVIREPDRRHWSSDEELKNSLETMVPNGAIVAIQDVHQHMYFTVEGNEDKYNLVGAVHYSLVGESALFMVKYNNQKGWNSSVLWFSLISLHAKNASGEPLRLNYLRGSDFVDVSSANDNAGSLWTAVSCEPESYEGDIDWEPYNQLIKRTFYLVNKKNDSAVAIVDGIPEFVRKPGNPIKLKVFHNAPIAHDIKMDNYPGEASVARPQQSDEGITSGKGGKLPCIDVTFDTISLTIIHELVDTKDMPLLRCCIGGTGQSKHELEESKDMALLGGCSDRTKRSKLTVQILPSKVRIISSLTTVVYYFDAQRNKWRELIHPVETCLFYRSSFQIQSSEAVSHGVPVHIHCRTKELNISLSELSLDILLFTVGKLNLAGPFSVKSTKIWANCCKVENQSGLNLLCQYDEQSVKVSRRQSTSIILRCSDSENQPPEMASVMSIRLTGPRSSLMTSPIHVSHLEAQAFAWRTQIMSLKDSQTYPGPFVIVDISRKSQDGLSILISPLVRIHNETGLSIKLRFRRSQQKEDVFASVVLNAGDTYDDSMAMFDAINLSGEEKKALRSLSLGNFLFSFRPEIPDGLMNSKKSISAEWSDDLKGGKAVRLSGIFDKLSYKVRKVLFSESAKSSFSTAHCTLKSEGANTVDMHFLIQSIRRNVPIVQPDRSMNLLENSKSPVALQEQKDIYLLPTVCVSNLLHTEMHVFVSESDGRPTIASDNDRNQSNISCGSMVEFYANPSIIYFTITLTGYDASCKPVNSSDWVKKLLKQKSDVPSVDIDLDFGGGKYSATLRLSRGSRGTLEAAIFTSYALKNDTEFGLCFFVSNKRPLSRDEAEKYGSSIPSEFGLYLPPKSTRSWFLKSSKVRLKLLKDNASETLIDLDALSGLAEISLETEEGSGIRSITKLGVSTGPPLSKVVVPSQIVTMVPRHVVINESGENIIVRQCYLQDDTVGMIPVNSKQRAPLQLWNVIDKKRDVSLFERVMKKHRKANDDSPIYLQFRLNESKLGWSGPVCIASLGRFFLKFKRQQLDQVPALESNVTEFASVHLVEEGSTLGLHFHKPPNVSLPYRIENCLPDVSITYYQKDSSEPEIIGSESCTDYVWDDLTLPHKLVVRINDSLLLREINLDKVRAWKPFYKTRQRSGLATHLPFGKDSGDKKGDFGEFNGMEMMKVGFEVYADGPTRVLRFCEISSSHKGNKMFQSCEKIQLRFNQFTVHLLEHEKQDGEDMEPPGYTPILAARIGNINFDSVFTYEQKFSQISVQSLNLENKWVGAPFAAMLRRHQSDFNDSNDCVLKIVIVLLSTSSNVVQVKYSSIALQPMDLNLDEETLMKIVPFWRTSLSEAKSSQYYFDHFEIHPIKIIANFLPGESYSSYSSAEETLRSLLHSVVKVPAIKNKVVELNGVMVTHALITMRELLIKCAQHYSWYAMRAIYIAKGSPLLPPDFVSIFDDLASSSLDVFFDPSRALVTLPGLTLGTFKLISKCIDGKGFLGTKRYFGDLGKSLRTAGSNVLFAAVTEISDSILKGAEASGFDGVVTGFHHGILKLAMEPSLLGTALMEGGPDRKIKLDRSPAVDELYIEGYLQAMLDTMYRQEYLRVRVIENQVYLKNLPPNSSLINEIMDRVKGFLVSKSLLKGDPSITSRPLGHLRGEREWRIGPTVLTLGEHLFVSFAIRILRKQANKCIANIKWKPESDGGRSIVAASSSEEVVKGKFIWKWGSGIGKFVLSAIVAYIDGRLCRSIPNPVARRIVSGFLLTFLDNNNSNE
ncbi:uncharacterized protein LOC133719495 isoform X1 [Rosa rugosa]|uniref:uncharacterized protein LOC133719495 isoform X1 n=1 Tax=Rosa rugosa TaxID=74645 RepID=UPI002B407437|nr:uncharacterized protein LOC133719495 isoform X1 [Rosa rugosa]